MSIPCKMRPVGLESLPMGYIRLDFLESNGGQYIDTNFEINTPENFKASVCFLIRGGARIAQGKAYSVCTSFWATPYNETEYIAAGIFNDPAQQTPLDQKVTVSSVVNEVRFLDRVYRLDSIAEANFVSMAMPENKRTVKLFAYADGSGYQSEWIRGNIYEFSAQCGNKATHIIPVLDPSGTPCMYDTVRDQNFYNRGTGSFIAGFDTTEKAAISLSKLPVTTEGTLTVSLPAEAEDPATLVPAAITIAKSRGWTIIEQLRTN